MICDKQYSPTYCEIDEYHHKTGRFIARGLNPCQARKKIFENLCDIKVDTIPPSEIYCAPDATQEECWELQPLECKDAETDSPYYCLVTTYAGRDIDAKIAPKSWGQSECRASNNLLQASCDRHLKPSGIEKFACAPTKLFEACPPLPHQCENTLDEHLCTYRLNKKNLLEVKGDNECIAKHKLQKRLCQLEINPAKIGAATCTKTETRTNP